MRADAKRSILTPDLAFRKRHSMFRRILVALGAAIFIGLLGIYALSKWLFSRRERPARRQARRPGTTAAINLLQFK
jgi:hypothetical protein